MESFNNRCLEAEFQALEKYKIEKKTEIARKLIEKGFDNTEISEITGLELEKIIELSSQ